MTRIFVPEIPPNPQLLMEKSKHIESDFGNSEFYTGLLRRHNLASYMLQVRR
jgi:hypothetical protein